MSISELTLKRVGLKLGKNVANEGGRINVVNGIIMAIHILQ